MRFWFAFLIYGRLMYLKKKDADILSGGILKFIEQPYILRPPR